MANIFRIRFKRDKTAAGWVSENPILLNGEPGVETDTGKFKIGDGLTAWNSLPYAGIGSVPAAHHTTHELGGSDAIKLDDLSTPDDTTDLDVTSARHGLIPKLPNDTTKFWRGDGQYASFAISPGSFFPVFTVPNNSEFAWVNQNAGTVSVGSLGVYLEYPASTLAQWHIRKKSRTGLYTLTIGFNSNVIFKSGADGSRTCVLWRESSSGALVLVSIDNVNAAPSMSVEKWSSETLFSSFYVTRAAIGLSPPMFWIQFTVNASNRIIKYSVDGENFITIHTVGNTDFMTADEVGFGVMEQSNLQAVGMIIRSWKETTEQPFHQTDWPNPRQQRGSVIDWIQSKR